MVVNGRTTKRFAKRRITADLSDFLTFPTAGDLTSQEAAKPFRVAVTAFLNKYARLPPISSLFPHLLTWRILFRIGDFDEYNGGPAVVSLDVVEEDVSRSRSVYCDQCRVVGWSSNPVSAKRYHFIIKAEGDSVDGHNKTCAGCGDVLHMSDSRCKSCNHLMTREDFEDSMYQQLECTTHLLHGVVHANGYGHLLRVNGREGGSRVLPGRSIMNFWDRLCRMLAVRKVSVMDVSKKNGLEFRLLHSVVKGHPWYGDWGYRFGAGSFSLTLMDYKMAVENLSSLPLAFFHSRGRNPRTRLQDLILFYQSLSEKELVTTRDLFSFLLNLIHDDHLPCLRVDDSPCKKLKTSDSTTLCSWTMYDIKRVEEAMFKVLRAVRGSTWVSWRALRGAVCREGTPQLLDYCLKELKGKEAAPGMLVAARCISCSSAMEYRLEPGSAPIHSSIPLNRFPVTSHPSKECLLGDLKFLYNCMLNPKSVVFTLPSAKRNLVVTSATKILDCKQFVKDYHPGQFLSLPDEDVVQVLCEVDLMEQPEEYDSQNPPPPELLVLSKNATIADLKHEAMKAFQDVYLMLRRFEVDEVVGFGAFDESTQVTLLLGFSSFVKIRGRVPGKNGLGRYRMERGLESWIVDCFCGAKDDDGERMLACDVCGIWQHTRCCGIPDFEGVPVNFLCKRCIQMRNGQCRGQVYNKMYVDLRRGVTDVAIL